MQTIEDLPDLQLEPQSKTHPTASGRVASGRRWIKTLVYQAPGQTILQDRVKPSAMQEFTANALEKWEDEGGATWRVGSDTAATTALTGTVNQIEWAEQIKASG